MISEDEIRRLTSQNEELKRKYQASVRYIREKVDQLLSVMGTSPLKTEELDDETLIEVDPIGIVSNSFVRILRHLNKTNEKVKIAHEEIKAIFESTGLGILVIDRDLRVLEYNSKLREYFIGGNGTSSMVGQPCYKFICQREDANACPFMKIFRSGENVHQEKWLLRDRYYNIIGTPVMHTNGGMTMAVLVYMDVTERILAEEALASEKERLLVTLRSIGDGVITTDIHETIVLINKSAENLTGWSQQEAAGRPIIEVFNVINEKTRLGANNPVSLALKSGKVVELENHTILVARDGAERVIADSVAPIMDRRSEIIGAVLVFRDITEKKDMECRLLKAEKIESLGVLAGGIAHDFNNLLNGVLGNIDLALTVPDLPDQVNTMLSRAEKAALMAVDLTSQLLTFSKGGAPIKNTASISELIKSSIDFVLLGTSVSCASFFSPDLWQVEIDEGQINQVINNLVINAVQAMPEGGLIHVSAENIIAGHINTQGLKEGGYVKITIKDEGIGISREDIGKIFEPYFTTKQTGSGLGLASAYSIIRNHNGLIEVESGVGSGTAFYLYLPALEGKVESKKEPHTAKLLEKGKGKILVMDDDSVVRETVGDMLNHLGYEAAFAAEGHDAIQIYKKAMETGCRFDAVIMDLTVPGGMGGKEAIRKLLTIDPGVRAIVSSGYSSDPIMANHTQYGFAGVVTKPCRIKALGEVIKTVLA